MKYQHQEKVLPALAERSHKDIDAVNSYMDSLRGTVITIERIRSGQPRPYADSVGEYRIALHQPNVLTTNSPMIRLIDEESAKAIARVIVLDFPKTDNPKDWWSTKLDYFRAEKNPWGLDEGSKEDGASACWHFQMTTPYTD